MRRKRSFLQPVVMIALLLAFACGDEPAEATVEPPPTPAPAEPCVPGCPAHRACEDGRCRPAHPQVTIAQLGACVLHEGRSLRCRQPHELGVGEDSFTAVEGAATEVAIGIVSCIVLDDGTVSCGFDDGPMTSVPDLRGASHLTMGLFRACVIEGTGGVACFGVRQGGEHRVTRFEGIDDARQLAAEGDYQCIRFEDSTIACGAESCHARSCLAEVSGIDHAIDVAVGGPRGCAVEAAGSVACFDLGGEGAPSAQRISGLEGARAIALGLQHGCVITNDSHVRCFGANDEGQFGTGALSLESARGPMPLANLSSHVGPVIEALDDVATIVAAGGATCAVGGADRIRCWGEGRVVQYLTPGGIAPLLHVVDGVANATDIAMGHDVACAIRGEAEPICWGRPLGSENAGVSWASTGSVRVMWTPNPDDPGVTPSAGDLVASPPQLRLGDNLSCANTDGVLACTNPRTELDHALLEAVRRAPALHGVVSVGATVCGLGAQGNVVCVGYLPMRIAPDGLGPSPLFDPSTVEGRVLFETNGHAFVYELGGLPEAPRELGGSESLFALTPHGQVYRWRGTPGAAWTLIEGLEQVRTLAFSANDACMVEVTGTVQCAPLFSRSRARPTRVYGLASVRALRGGFDSFCAAHEDGHVTCFGNRTARGVLGFLPFATPHEIYAGLQRPGE